MHRDGSAARLKFGNPGPNYSSSLRVCSTQSRTGALAQPAPISAPFCPPKPLLPARAVPVLQLQLQSPRGCGSALRLLLLPLGLLWRDQQWPSKSSSCKGAVEPLRSPGSVSKEHLLSSTCQGNAALPELLCQGWRRKRQGKAEGFQEWWWKGTRGAVVALRAAWAWVLPSLHWASGRAVAGVGQGVCLAPGHCCAGPGHWDPSCCLGLLWPGAAGAGGGSDWCKA